MAKEKVSEHISNNTKDFEALVSKQGIEAENVYLKMEKYSQEAAVKLMSKMHPEDLISNFEVIKSSGCYFIYAKIKRNGSVLESSRINCGGSVVRLKAKTLQKELLEIFGVLNKTV